MADRGTPIRKKWAMIAKGTDVLITHGASPAMVLNSVKGLPQGRYRLWLCLLLFFWYPCD